MRRRERMNKVKILKVIGAVLGSLFFSHNNLVYSLYVSSSVINALEIRVSPFVTF